MRVWCSHYLTLPAGWWQGHREGIRVQGTECGWLKVQRAVCDWLRVQGYFVDSLRVQGHCVTRSGFWGSVGGSGFRGSIIRFYY